MNRFKSKVAKSMVALSILAVAAVPSAFAETVSVTPGTLTNSQTAIAFSAVQLDLSQTQKSNADTTISVNDARGSGAGWSISIAATDFVSADIQDPSTADAASKIQATFPVSSVIATVGAPAFVAGQPIDAVSGPIASNKTLSNSAQTLVGAKSGYGMGNYTAPVAFELTLPKVIKVSKEGTGTLKTGADVGLMAATYTSTFTFSQTAGL
jgi:hypothetical protein